MTAPLAARRRSLGAVVGIVCLLLEGWGGGATARAGDWPCFRGPGRDGKAADAAPLEWSKDKNVKWRAKLPQPGNSSPIVVGQRVLITCAEDKGGNRRSLYCFNRADGQQAWVKTVEYPGKEPMHGTNPHCASTPASDGRRVVVWHGSAGVYCYDLEGKELWKADVGEFRHIWGYASSPVIHGETVYLNCGPGVRSFVTALSLADGKALWKTDVPGGADDKSPETKSWIGSWSTPVVAKVAGEEVLLVFQPKQLNAYDMKTGEVRWFISGTGPLAYTDVVVARDAEGNATGGAALAGFGGAGIGFKLGPDMKGDVTATHRLWTTKGRIPQRISSGVIVDGSLYVTSSERGPIFCFDAKTGEQRWTHDPVMTFWGSLVATPGRIYATNQKGTTLVFAPDPAGLKLLASNDLGEPTNSTPAVSDGQIFLRTRGTLWCVGK